MAAAADTTATTQQLDDLRQSDAVLLILKALQPEDGAVNRILVEGFASIARSPAYRDSKCRILAIFNTPAWRRRLYESLAHLEQTRCVSPTLAGYTLTDSGNERWGNIDTTTDETVRIHGVARHVQRSLGLNCHLP